MSNGIVDELNSNYYRSDSLFIKHMYETMIEYYSNNIGKESSITGAIITESMISTLQIRYRELYGHYFNL